MSLAMQKLSQQLDRLEVSASNLVTDVQSLKSQVATLSVNQEDTVGLEALAARLAVVQAGIDAVATVAAPGVGA